MNAETQVRAADNLRIWNEVSKTDPRHTKKVNQRGGFTAISAHYQVMSATNAFGPVGIGWGYSNGEPIWHETLVFVPVTLWHGDRENVFGPVYGGAEWKSDKGRLDSDAPKKAATDGLTKALSHLGFNADVFMGLFDDNKYVERVQKEFEAEEREAHAEKVPGISAIKRNLNAMMLAGNKATDLEVFNALVRSNADDLGKIKEANHDYWTGDPDYQEGESGHEGFKRWIVRRRAELAPPAETLELQLLLSTLAECETVMALKDYLTKNLAVIDELDDVERDRWEQSYNARETAIHAMGLVGA